jgi:hypothetical protein
MIDDPKIVAKLSSCLNAFQQRPNFALMPVKINMSVDRASARRSAAFISFFLFNSRARQQPGRGLDHLLVFA